MPTNPEQSQHDEQDHVQLFEIDERDIQLNLERC